MLPSSEEVENMPISLSQTSNDKLGNIPMSQNPDGKLSSKLYIPYQHAKQVNSTHVIDSETLRILFWTKWCSDVWWFLLETLIVKCGGLKCQYTHDKSLADVSDALLFFVNKRNYVKGITSAHPKVRAPNSTGLDTFKDHFCMVILMIWIN